MAPTRHINLFTNTATVHEWEKKGKVRVGEGRCGEKNMRIPRQLVQARRPVLVDTSLRLPAYLKLKSLARVLNRNEKDVVRHLTYRHKKDFYSLLGDSWYKFPSLKVWKEVPFSSVCITCPPYIHLIISSHWTLIIQSGCDHTIHSSCRVRWKYRKGSHKVWRYAWGAFTSASQK